MVKLDRALDTSDFTTRKSLWKDQTICIIHISDFGHQVYFTWLRGLHVDHAELLAEKLAVRLQRAYFPLSETALLTQTETGGE